MRDPSLIRVIRGYCEDCRIDVAAFFWKAVVFLSGHLSRP